MGLPHGAPEKTEPAQSHVRNRIECPSPANRKRTRICLAESGEMVASRTNQSDNATSRARCMSMEKDAGAGRNDEAPRPYLVTSTDLLDKEVVQEETAPDEIPAGWTRTKLEPDW